MEIKLGNFPPTNNTDASVYLQMWSERRASCRDWKWHEMREVEKATTSQSLRRKQKRGDGAVTGTNYGTGTKYHKQINTFCTQKRNVEANLAC
jgi:hypothetical protein